VEFTIKQINGIIGGKVQGDENLTITGVSSSKGELISPVYEREVRIWSVPTVKLHAHRAQGYYDFLRNALDKNQIPVAMVSSAYGRLIKFSLHDLVLKPGVPFGVIRLLRRRYAEAIDLWDEVPDIGYLASQQIAG